MYMHLYISRHIKKKCVEFFFFIILFFFSFLVRNENLKTSGFYTLQVTRVFSNFPQLKQLNKIKNICAPSNNSFLEFSTAKAP